MVFGPKARRAKLFVAHGRERTLVSNSDASGSCQVWGWEFSQNVPEDTPIVLLFDYQQPLEEHDVGVECGKAIRAAWQGNGRCIKLWRTWLELLRLECSQNVLEETPIVLSFDYQQPADCARLAIQQYQWCS